MIATTADLTAAQAGACIAVIAPTRAAARDDLDRLAPFAGPDTTIRRANGHTMIDYGRGHIRWLSALGAGFRGKTFDRIHLAEDAATDAVISNARRALAPNGELYIGSHLVTEPRAEESKA
jgi:hypothetical protein